MTKMIIDLEIHESGKTPQKRFLPLENTDSFVIAAEFFLSPHLSIGLPEDQSAKITFHSEEASPLSSEPDTVYSYTFFRGNHMSLPVHGSDFYLLQKGDTFSITKTQKDYYKVIKGEIVLVDYTPHHEHSFPEEIHISP